MIKMWSSASATFRTRGAAIYIASDVHSTSVLVVQCTSSPAVLDSPDLGKTEFEFLLLPLTVCELACVSIALPNLVSSSVKWGLWYLPHRYRG